jgi:murein DD-endopeptidase MepM/ murein hydrolase activator NlpD
MAGLIAALVLTGFSMPPSAQTVLAESSEEDIEDAKEKKEEAQKQIDAAREKVAALSGEASQLSSDLQYLEDLSAEQKEQYLVIAGELAAALEAKQAALDLYLQSQEDVSNKKQQYAERVSVMFEYQNKSTLEILLESDSLAGFFTNMELITLIAESDQQIIDELKAAMDDAELKSQYAKQEAADMQTLADQKQAELDELEGQIGETSAALARTQSALSDWEQKQLSLEDEAKRLDEEIRRMQDEQDEKRRQEEQERQKQNPSDPQPPQPQPSGQLTWPYPGDYTIYSPFGMRYHPVYGTYTMHSGVDLGGSYGNPIVAAGGGTVIIASAPVPGQNTGGSGYGNYIVIDHGNGMSTLYGHCRDLYVSVGDSVSAGQEIAACGSTGTSTGAHVHFEVRVNGERVDPAPYIQ